MSTWVANTAALAVLASALIIGALALLWRVGSWRVSPAASLNLDQGLSAGAQAPQIAVMSGEQEMHLSFVGRDAFVVFGVDGCRPCGGLLHVAASHPATRSMRRVYVTDDDGAVAGQALVQWEIYRFIDQKADRERWRAPVSPYFHLVDADGRILEKGLASRPEHLDRLLFIRPPAVPAPQPG